jgi:hypothetical protein
MSNAIGRDIEDAASDVAKDAHRDQDHDNKQRKHNEICAGNEDIDDEQGNIPDGNTIGIEEILTVSIGPFSFRRNRSFSRAFYRCRYTKARPKVRLVCRTKSEHEVPAER